MVRHLLILPDGSELCSGPEEENALQAVTLTQCVNSEEELTLGSVCISELQAELITHNGSLSLAAGDPVILYGVDEAENRKRIGVFYLEKPACHSDYIIQLTAYDAVSLLEKDLTDWLAGLEGWPYSLLTFAGMVCEACELTLDNDSLPNADYQIQAFSGQGITGRKLMQWVGQIAGRFCRATPEGNIELAWYEPVDLEISPEGERFYYQDGFNYEDYQVEPIEKVQLRLTGDDVGAVWPSETGPKNTYIISGNFLLTTTTTAALTPVAQTLFEMLKDVTYTHCQETLPASADICAGQILQIADKNGKTITAYIMKKTRTAQRDTLECTGSPRRDSLAVTNQESYKALNSRVLEIRKEVEGLSVKAEEMEALEVGGRNRLRRSGDLVFQDYFFSGDLVVTDDGAGNVTVVTGASAFDNGDGNILLRTSADVSNDGTGNVTLN